MVTLTTPDVNTFLVNFPARGNKMVIQNEDFNKSDIQSIEFQAHGLEASEEIAIITGLYGSDYFARAAQFNT